APSPPPWSKAHRRLLPAGLRDFSPAPADPLVLAPPVLRKLSTSGLGRRNRPWLLGSKRLWHSIAARQSPPEWRGRKAQRRPHRDKAASRWRSRRWPLEEPALPNGSYVPRPRRIACDRHDVRQAV